MQAMVKGGGNPRTVSGAGISRGDPYKRRMYASYSLLVPIRASCEAYFRGTHVLVCTM